MIKTKFTPSFLKKKGARLISAAIIAMAMIAGSVGSAGAVPLNWDAATTVTINSNSYTIAVGSAATSMIVGASTLEVVVPAASSFTLTSSSGYALNPDVSANTTQSCSGTIRSLVIVGDGTTKIITPNTGSVCVAPISGGGGSYTPPSTPTPTPSPAATPIPTVSPTPTPAVSPGPATPNANSGVTLYRVEGDNKVYVIKDGKKSHVKSAEEFTAVGYKWSNIVVVASTVLAGYPDKDAISSGATLYRAEGDAKVYVIKDNVKQWIKTAEEFNAAGYKWSDIVVTAPSLIASYSDGTAAIVKVKVVGTASLRVRKSNTTASSVLGNVKKNAIFTALEEKSGWYKITTSNGIVGWISGAYAVKQ